MGQFSWIYSNTKNAMKCNMEADSYLLIPQEFGGGYFHTASYDGYGRFDGHDVYEEVAKWNREFLNPGMLEPAPVKEEYSETQFYINALKRRIESITRMFHYRIGYTDAEMQKLHGKDYLREIGIDIACYDRQNAALPYPIKITSVSMAYEDAESSDGDPNQGW